LNTQSPTAHKELLKHIFIRESLNRNTARGPEIDDSAIIQQCHIMWNTILSHHLIDPPWTGNVTNEPIQYEPSETQTSQNQEALAERCTNGAHAYAYSAPHLYSRSSSNRKCGTDPEYTNIKQINKSKGSEPRFARSTNTDRQQLPSRSSSTSSETQDQARLTRQTESVTNYAVDNPAHRRKR
jgi:hypothetical protein